MTADRSDPEAQPEGRTAEAERAGLEQAGADEALALAVMLIDAAGVVTRKRVRDGQGDALAAAQAELALLVRARAALLRLRHNLLIGGD